MFKKNFMQEQYNYFTCYGFSDIAHFVKITKGLTETPKRPTNKQTRNIQQYKYRKDYKKTNKVGDR